MVSVRADVRRAERALGNLRRLVPIASRQALNRAGITLRKEARNNLADLVRPRRKKDISSAITLQRATRTRPYIQIVTKDAHLGLERTRETRVQSFRRGKRRVQRVRFRGKTLRGAFRPKGIRPEGAIVSQRPGKYSTGTRRLKRLYAYSLLQETRSKRLLTKLEPTARRRWRIEFRRALANQMRRA